GPISVRLAWSWRDEYLMSIGPNGFNGDNGGLGASSGEYWKLPVYSDDSGQLDGSIFYSINDNLSIGLEMNNLTNEETRTIMKQNKDGAGDHYASHFVNDTRYALTLRANFYLAIYLAPTAAVQGSLCCAVKMLFSNFYSVNKISWITVVLIKEIVLFTAMSCRVGALYAHIR